MALSLAKTCRARLSAGVSNPATTLANAQRAHRAQRQERHFVRHDAGAGNPPLTASAFEAGKLNRLDPQAWRANTPPAIFSGYP